MRRADREIKDSEETGKVSEINALNCESIMIY